MTQNHAEFLDKMRKQFDFGPYPRTPIEVPPKTLPEQLYNQNLNTSYYLRNQKVFNASDPVILDVGCGTGFTSLILAAANPNAKVIGIDISEKSIELSQERIKYHNKEEQCEFYVMSVDDLPSFQFTFDYINCDEVLYMLPDPLQGLKNFKNQLKPSGIIRANIHNYAQRFNILRAQQMFGMMGFIEKDVDDDDVQTVIDIIKALKDTVHLKRATWSDSYEKETLKKEFVIENYLMKGDKGYTIADMFTLLNAADLEFVSMFNWRQWLLTDLFKEPENLPVFLALALPDTTPAEQLQLFEFLHPIHRLLDFWCGHPGAGQPFVPVAEWTDEDWYGATIHLHPQLKTPEVQTAFRDCCKTLQAFPISKYLPILGGQTTSLDITLAACLLPPLLEAPQNISSFIQRFKTIKPVNLETLEETTDVESFTILRDILTGLEAYGYVMIEHS